MQNKKIKYYVDETKDDFQPTKTYFSVTVDGNYKYLNNSKAFKFFSFILYYLIASPLLAIYSFLILGIRVKGKKNLKPLKKTGYFIYANHTHYIDAWLGSVLINLFSKRNYIIANKDAIQIPVVDKLVKALGALPVADTVSGLKNLTDAVTTIVNNNKVVTIFPEAHIWYYYTKVRPFPLTSFKFPVISNKPVLPVAVTYKKRKLFPFLKPRMIVNIGKPIFPKPELSDKENITYLRDEVYNYIKQQTSSPDNFAYYEYVKVTEEELKKLTQSN